MTRHFALVPAAGNGARFGSDVPKQYLQLAGQPLIYHALAALCRCSRIEQVRVVLSPGSGGLPTTGRDLPENFVRSIAAVQRKAESVANGLAAVSGELKKDDWVLVHDAARPCLSQAMLNTLFAGTDQRSRGWHSCHARGRYTQTC